MTTQQQFFDRTVTALLKQGQPSHNGDACLYRGPENLKCAIGHWIPDDEWAANPNEAAINSESVCDLWPTIDKLREDVGLDLLIVMQNAHDSDVFGTPEVWVENFKSSARDIARDYNLDAGAAA